jgi:hypothetical protein
MSTRDPASNRPSSPHAKHAETDIDNRSITAAEPTWRQAALMGAFHATMLADHADSPSARLNRSVSDSGPDLSSPENWHENLLAAIEGVVDQVENLIAHRVLRAYST